MRFSRAERKEALVAYALISPWLLGFIFVTAGPMIASIILSFFKYDIIHPAQFVGVQNYVHMAKEDPLFWQSLKVTAIYVLFGVPLTLSVSLAMALLLNNAVRGITIFRTIFYLPAVMSGVAVALLWQWVFNPNYGILNYLLEMVGIIGPNWLGDENWVLPAFIIMSLWGAGSGMVILLAGLQGIPTQLYEAARIDGATWWQEFFKITLPMLSPTLFFNLVMNIISSWQVFTPAYVMTQGGPNYGSLFYVFYLYRNAFVEFKMGYACALAWVMFFIILLCTLAVFKSSPMWVYYEAERRQ